MGRKILRAVYILFSIAAVMTATLFGLGKIGRGGTVAEVTFIAAAILTAIYLLSLHKK